MRASLNDEGRRIWGYVFPDGEVPVMTMGPQEASVEGLGKMQMYIVNWNALTDEQKKLIINHLKERFNSSEEVVKAEIQKSGLPLRAELVSHVAIPGRFF
jgi:predicted Fe-S protein YdhL (DUF1289 family)